MDAGTTSRRPVVLLIEDERDHLELLAEILSHAGYVCECAGSCAEGRGLFSEGRFGCTVVDLGLPDGNGKTLLEEFAKTDPCIVQVVLTGDSSPETIIDTMRAGAFDYLTKPIDPTTLKATIARALSHHAVVRERTEVIQLLLEERKQLKAKIEEATADLRAYAGACETSNTRLRTLLELTQLSARYSSEEALMPRAFKEVRKHLPLKCVCLCDVMRERLISVFEREDGEIEFVSTEGGSANVGYDRLLAEAKPESLVQSWVERNTSLDTSGLRLFAYPQTFWNRTVSTVGFYLSAEFAGDEAEREFLGMYARYLAFECEQSNLMLYVAQQASLGNIAVELARNFAQPLTAIQTASDIITEAALTADVKEGMQVVNQNVDRLRRQTQEFRRLSFLREDSVETVHLDEYVEQALGLLSVAIQNRGVKIDREFEADSECVLLNGTALARTFLALILDALRSVHAGSTIRLCLRDIGNDYIAFEMSHEAKMLGAETPRSPNGLMPLSFGSSLYTSPGLLLAERTVHRCGGKLSVEQSDGDKSTLRIILPKNATKPATIGEAVR